MSFYGEAELEGLEAQCWSTLGDWRRAARHARRAAELQDPHFTRNIALYTAELADDLARGGRPDEAAVAGMRVLDLLERGPVVPDPDDAGGHGASVASAPPGFGGVGVPGRHAACLARRGSPAVTGQPHRCPRSFQLSIAGSPYAQPSTDRDVGFSRIRAAKSIGRPSHRAPMERRMCPWAKTRTSRSCERAQATTSSARAVTSASDSALRDAVAPDQPAGPDGLDVRRGHALVGPVVPLHAACPRHARGRRNRPVRMSHARVPAGWCAPRRRAARRKAPGADARRAAWLRAGPPPGAARRSCPCACRTATTRVCPCRASRMRGAMGNLSGRNARAELLHHRARLRGQPGGRSLRL